MSKKEFIKRFEKRPLSHSQLNSWEWDPVQWYRSYIEGVRDPATPAMLYGNVVGDSIGTDDSLVPELKTPGVKEYSLRASLGKIHMIGYADHYCHKTFELHENKTSTNLKRWDQKKVDDAKQLSMYALLIFLQNGTPPEDLKIYLNFIPVEVGQDFQYKMPEPPQVMTFETRRTTADITEYSAYVIKTVDKMYDYVKARQI